MRAVGACVIVYMRRYVSVYVRLCVRACAQVCRCVGVYVSYVCVSVGEYERLCLRKCNCKCMCVGLNVCRRECMCVSNTLLSIMYMNYCNKYAEDRSRRLSQPTEDRHGHEVLAISSFFASAYEGWG